MCGTVCAILTSTPGGSSPMPADCGLCPPLPTAAFAPIPRSWVDPPTFRCRQPLFIANSVYQESVQQFVGRKANGNYPSTFHNALLDLFALHPACGGRGLIISRILISLLLVNSHDLGRRRGSGCSSVKLA
ncbi:hypothetical protein KIL84_020125 [Mauremys mutica]|uniref:Uncharacterized protein n=1 Tax=Mauremys mutica TaxID=74926 RepID=A0A9D3XW48_9SAUR|nr:hypothetical protein KIL84_020125 [Mauremys mutica]